MRQPIRIAILLTVWAGLARGQVPDRYRSAVEKLDPFIAREVAAKRIPALSIAIVDDQSIVWSRGYGFADPATAKPATADTVYRVGSVSKLFTDIAVMQLVEGGKLDLDAPVSNVLPDFAAKGPITLRQMMAHRSGLVREPPIGHYFDPKPPGLAATVASLNPTELVYPIGTRLKYSNAAIAAVGLALEKAGGAPYDRQVADRVLTPLGMTASSFTPTPAVLANLAKATMWTEHGRDFPAPTFELGIAPAGCLYSTVGDLGKFLEALFRRGTPVLKPETLDSMLAIQFAQPGETRGFGLGFSLSRFEGHSRIGHGGAIYGFATELAALPDRKLGVVVIASKDCANAVTTRIADETLRQMLAVSEGRALPAIEETKPLPPGAALKWAGRYKSPHGSFELDPDGSRLFMIHTNGGSRVEVRSLGQSMMVDDVLGFGLRMTPQGDALRVGAELYTKLPDAMPPPPPAHFVGLIGEYGWDHNVLYILEREGRLYAQIEWFFLYPLAERSPDVYDFPDSGLYQGEKLIFKRDATGRATEVEAASVTFRRRDLDGEDGRTFRIKPTRPVDQIRAGLEGSRPPVEDGEFRAPDLVPLTSVIPGLKLDIRYATDNNFLGVPVYPETARAIMQRPAAEALGRVQDRLAAQGYGLLIHDAYRPWSITKLFWEATPEAQHTFVANPALGSKHNRGCAVDLSIADLTTGQPIPMTGGYDEFSDRSYPHYPGGTSLQRWHRDLLRRTMEAEGFTVNEAEWWHFDYQDWRQYPILDVPFTER